MVRLAAISPNTSVRSYMALSKICRLGTLEDERDSAKSPELCFFADSGLVYPAESARDRFQPYSGRRWPATITLRQRSVSSSSIALISVGVPPTALNVISRQRRSISGS